MRNILAVSFFIALSLSAILVQPVSGEINNTNSKLSQAYKLLGSIDYYSLSTAESGIVLVSWHHSSNGIDQESSGAESSPFYYEIFVSLNEDQLFQAENVVHRQECVSECFSKKMYQVENLVPGMKYYFGIRLNNGSETELYYTTGSIRASEGVGIRDDIDFFDAADLDKDIIKLIVKEDTMYVEIMDKTISVVDGGYIALLED